MLLNSTVFLVNHKCPIQSIVINNYQINLSKIFLNIAINYQFCCLKVKKYYAKALISHEIVYLFGEYLAIINVMRSGISGLIRLILMSVMKKRPKKIKDQIY